MEEVLKSLGYRSQKHLEEDIFPQPKTPATDTDTRENAGSDAVAGTASEPDIGVDTEAVSVKAPSELSTVSNLEENGSADSETSGPEATESVKEPKYVLLWQRHFKSKPHHKNPVKGKPNLNAGRGKNHADKSSHAAKKKPHSAKKPEQKIDPDSPFAKLAALKESMKGNG